MKKGTRRFVLLVVGFAIAFATARAQAQLALKGDILFKDDFDTPTNYTPRPQPVANGWTVQVAHSNWKKTSDGVQSVWRNGHMPVLQFNCEHPLGDIVIEVEFRFHKEAGKNGPNQGAACRISPTNPLLDPSGYCASVWANLDSKDRQPGMVLEHDEWKPNGIVTVDHKPAKFESDKWYPVRMELIGDTALATCNGVSVYGSHNQFGLPKTVVALGSGYCVHDFRFLRIYKATPNPKWSPPAPEKNAGDAKPKAASL